MRKLINERNKHRGHPAAILGGGPSLPADYARLPDRVLLFAVNDHAFHIGIQPHYMVVMDDPHIKPELLRLSQPGQSHTRINDLLEWTDVDLRGVHKPSMRSGLTAAWLALYYGCAPVYLCGMDLYQNGTRYCHDRDEFMGKKAIYTEPLEDHLTAWRKLKRYDPHGAIRAMSGPLTALFPPAFPNEYKPSSDLTHKKATQMVNLLTDYLAANPENLTDAQLEELARDWASAILAEAVQKNLGGCLLCGN